MTISPAYGRDYLSKEAVLDALNALKDFSLGGGGPYISISEMKEGFEFAVRYNKLTKKILCKKVNGKAIITE